MFKETKNLEQEKVTNDIEIIREEYKRVIKKFNTLAKRYTKVKIIVDDTIIKTEQLQKENFKLRQENLNLKNEIIKLKDYIDKTFKFVNLLFDFPQDSLKRLINSFIGKFKSKEK